MITTARRRDRCYESLAMSVAPASTAPARLLFVLLTALATLLPEAAGCSSSAAGDDAPSALVVPDGCQPLLASPGDGPAATGTCLVPYPSDFHRVADATSSTGFRLGLRGAARPRTASGEENDVHDVVAMDGASLIPTIVAGLAGDIVHDGLPGILDEPAKSARPEAGSVLLDAEANELVAHYTDVVDRRDGSHTPIVLRTFAPLKPRTRYVVAISGARLGAPDGSGAAAELAPPPEGFRRLRDGTADADAALVPLAARYDREVFSPLARAGVALDRLQLAWDFTTGSAEQPVADMLRVRDLTLAWLAKSEPAVRVTGTRDGTGNLAQIVNIEVTAPLFLSRPGPGAHLSRDGAAQIVQNGTTTFQLVVAVPKVVRDRPEPGRVIAIGHGFFGSTAELEGGASRAIAEQVGAVLFGVDWWGMSKDDLATVSDTLVTAPAHVADFAERTHQGMANWLVALAAMRGPVTRLPELRRPSMAALYDPSFVGYFGASMGHILGGTLAALADFPRVVLNVGGGAFTHCMPRSLNFGPFSLLLGTVFQDPLVVQSYVAMMQRPLDTIDPISYAQYVLASKLPGSPEDRRVLMQIGLGDPAVPNLASYLHARALGIPLVIPSPTSVFGLPGVSAAEAPSSLTIFDYGVDTTGYAEGKPISPNLVHDTVRLNPAALRQMVTFLRPGGVITQTCDGACDPE